MVWKYRIYLSKPAGRGHRESIMRGGRSDRHRKRDREGETERDRDPNREGKTRNYRERDSQIEIQRERWGEGGSCLALDILQCQTNLS